MENKNKKIPISVIIKTKNAQNTLYSTLESTKNCDEIIVLDEHSTDDTIEIIQEYRAKIIYFDEIKSAFNQAINEAKNDWIFIIEQDEIISNNLLNEIKNYISNPKKNKDIVSFKLKTFYLKKEIKAAREKNLLRLFKKGSVDFSFEPELKINKKGKVFKLKSNYKKDNSCILKYLESDISKTLQKIILKDKILSKNIDKSTGIIKKPILKFLYWYLFKGAIFDFEYGFIFSKLKFIEEFILQVMILEKNQKKEMEDDF